MQHYALGWRGAQDLWEPREDRPQGRPDGGRGESRGGSTGGILQAEVAEREVEPLHNELVLATVGTRAGEGRLDRGKDPNSGSRGISGLLNLCCWPLGLGQLGSGNDCGWG